MTTTISLPTIPFGFWNLAFNLVLFVVVCLLLVATQMYPDYKVGLFVLIGGFLLIHFNTMLRYYWHDQNQKALRKAQQANIVPNHCPDYWVKVHDGTSEKCVNQFVTPTGIESSIEYTFGGSNAANQYDLETLSSLTNQQKCVSNAAIKSWVNVVPWVDMQNKCMDANV